MCIRDSFVIQNLSSACILGANFLRNAKISRNLENNTASLPDGSISAITMSAPSEASTIPEAAAAAKQNLLLPILRAGETTVIPPFSSKHVQTTAHFPPGMAAPANGLVECHGDENAILNGAITISSERKARVTMLNPAAEPITIPRGEIVAHISALPEEDTIIQLLPATDSEPIAAITQVSTNNHPGCHLCEETNDSCANCASISPTAEADNSQNLLQATSCVTNATWGPKTISAKTSISNSNMQEI